MNPRSGRRSFGDNFLPHAAEDMYLAATDALAALVFIRNDLRVSFFRAINFYTIQINSISRKEYENAR